MTVRVAIVGAGRIGTALGALWQRNGIEVTGWVARRPEAADAAIATAGGGRAIDLEALASESLVVLAVGDSDLADVVARCASSVGEDSLWIHTSGVHGLDVLAPLGDAGARIGSLHPVCPVPDAETGIRELPGQPGVWQAAGSACDEIVALAKAAGLSPIAMAPGADRATYHAACALAANGLTALVDQVRRLLATDHGIEPREAGALVSSLMSAALRAIDRSDPGRALSGPAHRGDAATIERHLDALGRSDAGALPSYCALMTLAADLALRTGDLDEASAQRLREVLGGSE